MKVPGKLVVVLFMFLLLPASLLDAGCSSDKNSPTRNITPPLSKETPTPTPTMSLPPWTGDSVVQTLYGTVKGFADESDTWVWKAVPYARPPVGELRWKAPRDPVSWEGIRQETDFCQMCPQYDWLIAEDVWGNEDCLYLNVWRPQSEETDLPVYVYIHGGGNAIGCANQVPTYYGSTVARKSNMIYVSMNYRLGPFGWFTHPALRTGDVIDGSGNYGTLDIIKALEWIQENIEAFGGDPENVILTGESAGCTNIHSLLESPLAKGLFHRALAQSCMNYSAPIEEGDAHSRDILIELLVSDGTADNEAGAGARLNEMSDAEIADYLRAKTPKEILACCEQREFGEVINPNIFRDGKVIVADGINSFENGTYPNKVPLMLGSTREELKMFLFMVESFEGKDELYQTVTSYGGDLWKAAGVDTIARQLGRHDDQPEIYVYRFNWGAWKEDGTSPIPAPYDLKVGAAHSLDQSFFLGNPCFNVFMTSWVFTEENRPGREALTDDIMAYVAQFARTGNPNEPGSGLPEWEPWTNETGEPKCMLLDADLNDSDIEMSPIEFTLPGVLESMKSDVAEPLYNEAFDILSSYRITAPLIKEAQHSE